MWNIEFNDFFDLPLTKYCTLTGYADDGLLLIHANSRSSLGLLANNSFRIVADWGMSNRLTFAPYKIYQLLHKGKLQMLLRISFSRVTVVKRNSVCYLGLLLNKKINFIDHMIQICEGYQVHLETIT
jgi:hypothetical protein